MWAAIKGHEAALKVLLQEGADPTVQDQVSE
jgi:ankyrin repeat protein